MDFRYPETSSIGEPKLLGSIRFVITDHPLKRIERLAVTTHVVRTDVIQTVRQMGPDVNLYRW